MITLCNFINLHAQFITAQKILQALSHCLNMPLDKLNLRSVQSVLFIKLRVNVAAPIDVTRRSKILQWNFRPRRLWTYGRNFQGSKHCPHKFAFNVFQTSRRLVANIENPDNQKCIRANIKRLADDGQADNRSARTFSDRRCPVRLRQKNFPLADKSIRRRAREHIHA